MPWHVHSFSYQYSIMFVYREENKLWSSTLRNVSQPPTPPSILSPNILLNTYFVISWFFFGEGLLAPRPTPPRLRTTHFDGSHLLNQYIRSHHLHLEHTSSIRNLRTLHALVTRVLPNTETVPCYIATLRWLSSCTAWSRRRSRFLAHP
jgi:hypothetical protein